MLLKEKGHSLANGDGEYGNTPNKFRVEIFELSKKERKIEY